jgi:quercetin dioxygenase-like cupin family protein
MNFKINLENIMNKINGKHCQPIDLVKANDQVIRMSYVDGTFHWHKHIYQDEIFYLVKGKLIIQLKNQSNIKLSAGEMTVIPKGVEHCPKSIEPSFILLFEPISLQTKGD